MKRGKRKLFFAPSLALHPQFSYLLLCNLYVNEIEMNQKEVKRDERRERGLIKYAQDGEESENRDDGEAERFQSQTYCSLLTSIFSFFFYVSRNQDPRFDFN